MAISSVVISWAATMIFHRGRGNCIIGTQEGGIVEIPIEEALTMKRHLQMDRYRIMEAMQVGGTLNRLDSLEL